MISRVRDHNAFSSPALPIATLAAATMMLAACSGGNGDGAAKGKGGPGAGKPPEVGVITVQPSSVPVTVELAGRTSAYEASEVRPQVSGIVRRRLFTEGSVVRAGQTLYEIDPSIYAAQAAQAQANLQSANASLEAARIRADRYRPLAEIEAVSKQEFTDARAQSQQAAASVAQSQAQLTAARINLRFTRVAAPITGRIGRSLGTVGALVTANQADPLAVIQRLDPIYVDIQQSSADLLALRRSLASNGVVAASAEVHLKLEDGSDYPAAGTVEFAEAVVNAGTGTVTLRARFMNPQGLLLPGMFVRATFAQSINNNAFLVPQQAVARDPKGGATVLVVGPGNKVVLRDITASRAVGNQWVVTAGLRPGDRIIVEGTARAKPNQPVRPVPAGSAQRIAPPPKGQQGNGGPQGGSAPGGGGTGAGAGAGGASKGG